MKSRAVGRRTSSSSVRVTADGKGLTRVYDFYDRFARAQAIPDQIRRDVYVALEEIVSNIVRHGAQERTRYLTVSLSIDARTFELEIVDDGPPFNPFGAPPPDTTVPLLERREGGLGILFVERLTDEHTYVRRDNRNRVTLRRALPARKKR